MSKYILEIDATQNSPAGIDLNKANELQQENQRLAIENEELRTNSEALIQLLNQKDSYALELKNELEYYKNLRVVRLYQLALRLVRGVMSRVKRVF